MPSPKKTTKTIDFDKPYSKVFGKTSNRGGPKYLQNGDYFNARGEFLHRSKSAGEDESAKQETKAKPAPKQTKEPEPKEPSSGEVGPVTAPPLGSDNE